MFRIARLQFEIELLDDLAPRGYWGSRLRGGFGDGLLLTLCPEASPSNLREHPADCRCDYLRLFKPTQRGLGITVTGPPLGGGADLPAAFVMDPPQEIGYPGKGQRLVFGLVLFGPMCDHVADCVGAFVKFGRIGVTGRNGAPAKFRILAVRDQLAFGRSVYSSGEVGPVSTRSIKDVSSESPAAQAQELLVEFHTNVQVHNKTARSRDAVTGLKTFSTFWDLVSNVAHRVACLWQAYGDDWPGKDEYKIWRDGLLQKSREISTVEQKLETRQLWGYSNNREERKSLHGFTGAMRCAGDFAPFVELLRAGEIVHIGSETANGLVQYSMIFTQPK
jgi:hypothetical protein